MANEIAKSLNEKPRQSAGLPFIDGNALAVLALLAAALLAALSGTIRLLLLARLLAAALLLPGLLVALLLLAMALIGILILILTHNLYSSNVAGFGGSKTSRLPGL